MPQYVLAQESRMANIPDKLWYAMERSDLAQIAANESVSLGDKVYVLKQGKMYMYGADSRWYDMGAGNSGGDVNVEPLEVTSNGTYTAEEGHAYNPVAVSVEPTLMLRAITENGTYTAQDDNADGYSAVDVDVTPSLGTKAITSNGTYYAVSDNFDGYDVVDVEVQPYLDTKSITSNGTYNASSDGLDGYSSVTVNVSGATVTQFASEGTIANPAETVTSGNFLAAAFAAHKYFELTFSFGGTTIVLPAQFRSSAVVAHGCDVSNLVVTNMFVGWTIQNLQLVFDELFVAQMNTDGTGFVDMTSMLPTSTPATVTGYYWN